MKNVKKQYNRYTVNVRKRTYHPTNLRKTPKKSAENHKRRTVTDHIAGHTCIDIFMELQYLYKCE